MLRKLVAMSNLIDHISISTFLFLFSTYETAKVQIKLYNEAKGVKIIARYK